MRATWEGSPIAGKRTAAAPVSNPPLRQRRGRGPPRCHEVSERTKPSKGISVKVGLTRKLARIWHATSVEFPLCPTSVGSALLNSIWRGCISRISGY